jgi:OMF family outer membrane factor
LASGSAEVKNLELKRAYAHQAWKSSVSEQLPVLSFVSSMAWQNNSNRTFLDNESRWINSNYVGLKLTWDFPTSVSKYTMARSKRLNEQMATINWENMQMQNTLKNQQLNNDYHKAGRDFEMESHILDLNRKSFYHSQQQYAQDILSLDKLLLAQEKYLSSSLNLVSAKANVIYQMNKIRINNEN